MSFLEPKTIPLFYFTGEKATTPTCPVEMQPNLNPSSGAQSYKRADAGCTRSAKYNIPFFLENLGPTFSEWSVNAHEARPGHHTQVMPVLSLDWLSCVGSFPFCQTKQSDSNGIIQEKKKATVFDWTKFPIESTRSICVSTEILITAKQSRPMETRTFGNHGTASFRWTGQRGPPLEVDHFEWKISTWTEAFHIYFSTEISESFGIMESTPCYWWQLERLPYLRASQSERT